MKRTKQKPYIYKGATVWFLNIGMNVWSCITWQEAVLTFNKIRFERITQK